MSRLPVPAAPAAPAAAAVRRAFGHLATGVTVLTTVDGGGPGGMTVSSLLTLTLEPPRLLVSLHQDSLTLAALRRRGAFALSVLGAADADVSTRFATAVRGDRFAGLALGDWSGIPVLSSALAWFGCEVEQTYAIGDHVLVAGVVRATGTGTGTVGPLVRYRHAYHALPAEAG